MNDFKGLHFVTGEKGGVGKSLFAMVLLEYLNNSGFEYNFYDADRSSPDVGLAYGEKDGSFENIGNEIVNFGCFDNVLALDETEDIEKDFIPSESLDEVESKESEVMVAQIYFSDSENESFKADRLYLEATEGLVVVNLPAQVEFFLDKWLRDRHILQDDSLNIYYWFVTDGSFESLDLLDNSLNRYGNRINHIVVRNKGLNKLIDQNLCAHPVLKTMRSLGMRRTVELGQWIVSNPQMQIIKKTKAKISDVINKQIPGITSITKLRTKTFLKQVHIEIDRSLVFSEPVDSVNLKEVMPNTSA